MPHWWLSFRKLLVLLSLVFIRMVCHSYVVFWVSHIGALLFAHGIGWVVGLHLQLFYLNVFWCNTFTGETFYSKKSFINPYLKRSNYLWLSVDKVMIPKKETKRRWNFGLKQAQIKGLYGHKQYISIHVNKSAAAYHMLSL